MGGSHDSDAPRAVPRRSDPAALYVAPSQVLAWSADEADEMLDRLEERVPQRPRLVELHAGDGPRAIAFGDSHGDWRSTAEPVARFLADPGRSILVGLGDYIDRSPSDCGAGSVANAVSLLSLAADHPGRVVLIVGNHEIVRKVPALPHDLPEEIDQLWGPQQDRYDRLLGLLERGPLAARTESGVYLAHAGFPRGDGNDWAERFAHPNEETLIDVTWSDCAGSGYSRGLAPPLEEPEVRRFLGRIKCRVFLRGHDPPLTGRSIFHGTVLTLHTTRLYEEFGGVIYATFPLDRAVGGVTDVEIHHAASEGRHYPEP